MIDIDFFSSNSYIYLPTKENPKVALVVDDKLFARNSFKLYNPFSLKAKVLKKISLLCFQILPTVQKEKSEFVTFLEHKMKIDLIVSIYFATLKDKVVLQLQSKDAKIVGYLKYPISDIGKKHIQNEIKAYNILSKLKIIDSYKLVDKYKSNSFILLDEISGEIGVVENINTIVDKFRRYENFTLSSHPRIVGLKEQLKDLNNKEYLHIIDKITANSSKKYSLVYEHGDFAPWNIVKTEDGYIPFDFEYFTEDGIEYFDAIKFYYQTGKLLKKLNKESLFNYIKQNLKIKEFEIIFALFLIKEILLQIEEKKKYDFEKRMLKFIKDRL